MGGLLAMLFMWAHRILRLLPSFVSSRVYGTLFGLRIGLGIPVSPSIDKRSTFITLPSGEKCPTSVYTSAPSSSSSSATTTTTTIPARTIVVVHGLSATAHEDPRIVNLAQSLAAASPYHIVVVPYLRPLAEVDLSDNPIGLISDALSTVSADPQLCPSGGVISVASACISAGYVLCAAPRATITLDALFLIGPHASAWPVLDHTIARNGAGDTRYALYAILSSFITPKHGPLARMLAAYVFDDHMANIDRPSDTVQPLLDAFPDEAPQYRRIRDDGKHACDLLQQLMVTYKKEIDAMCGIEVIDKIDVRYVSLVHSKKDDIVPYGQSVLLKEAWDRAKNTKVSISITSLLNHGDQEPISPSDLPEILRLIDCFSTFFRPVHRRPPTPQASGTEHSVQSSETS